MPLEKARSIITARHETFNGFRNTASVNSGRNGASLLEMGTGDPFERGTVQDWVCSFYAKGKCGNFTKDSKLSIEGLSAHMFLEKKKRRERKF